MEKIESIATWTNHQGVFTTIALALPDLLYAAPHLFRGTDGGAVGMTGEAKRLTVMSLIEKIKSKILSTSGRQGALFVWMWTEG